MNKAADKFLRRQFRLPAWLLVAYFVLMNVVVMYAIFADSMRLTLEALARGELSPQMDMEALTNNAWGYLVAVAIAMMFLFAWKDRPFWRRQLLESRGRMTAGIFLTLLCLCMTAQLLNSFWVTGLEAVMNFFGKSLMETLESVSGSSDSLSMFLYASIAAPITEEIIFRGYIQGELEKYGRKFAILGSAFLFGIFHGNLIQTPYAFVMGLVLGYAAAEYHIGWAIGIHLFNNLVLADLLSRATAGLPEAAAGAIQLVLLGGAALAAVIVLVAKRRAVGSYLTREWVDRRCLKCFFTNSGMIVLLVLMALNGLLILAA